MDHIAKITAQLPEHGLDAMLVTSAPGERYAVGFEGEGWVLVSRDGARYSTDGRYIEAARQQVTGAEIVLTERGQSHLALAREEIRRRGLKRVGFESGRVSADELGRWKDSLPCELVAAQGLLDGLRAADEDQMSLLRAMGANRLQIFWHIKLPGALPAFFSGLKISVSFSIVGAVIAEWLGGQSGLGVYMTLARKSFAYADMFAVIFLVVAISLVLMGVTGFLEKKLTPWRQIKKV